MVRTFKATCLALLVFETYSRMNKSKKRKDETKTKKRKPPDGHTDKLHKEERECQQDDKQQPF